MCTYLTEHVDIEGSGKFADGWAATRRATVYFDHPVHAMAEHSLNIDFFAVAGAGAAGTAAPGDAADAAVRRIAVELTPESARALATAIQRALDSAPAGLVAG